MTSEAKIAANKRNAQRSTGPRAALAKARIRRNALRHGLAALVVSDPAVAAEVERVAAAIFGEHADRLEREQALVVAEAQVTLKRVRRARAQIMEQMSLMPATQNPDARDTLKRVRRARAQIMEQMSLVPPTQHPDARDSASMVDCAAPYLDQLMGLERYERRALSRRKRAVRLAWLRDPEKINEGSA